MVSETMELPAVLGIGNALVDVMIALEDDTLIYNFRLPKGSMTLVDEQLSEKIYRSVSSFIKNITTGGSAANTIYTLARLGGRAGYLGKTGADALGQSFKQELEERNVRTHLFTSEKSTGRVMALVSPDSERTMATCLGAAADLKPEEINPEEFRGYAVLYIEGYLVQDHRLIEKALKTARQEGLKIAIDLSSYTVVEQNLDFLKGILSAYVDMVFANEEEALVFTGKMPEQAVEELAGLCETAIVKIGKTGSLIRQGDDLVQVKSFPARAIDTTGAGDSYAAGFLYGYTKGCSLETCGKMASFVSARMVEVMGAKLPEHVWPEILQTIKTF
jgi:sugar/nucleoside kinase (ribokinase family)